MGKGWWSQEAQPQRPLGRQERQQQRRRRKAKHRLINLFGWHHSRKADVPQPYPVFCQNWGEAVTPSWLTDWPAGAKQQQQQLSLLCSGPPSATGFAQGPTGHFRESKTTLESPPRSGRLRQRPPTPAPPQDVAARCWAPCAAAPARRSSCRHAQCRLASQLRKKSRR